MPPSQGRVATGRRASISRPIAPLHVHTGFPAIISAAKAVVATPPEIVAAVGTIIDTAAVNPATEVVLEN